MHKVVFNSIDEASRLLDTRNTRPTQAEVGIRVNIDTGDTIEQLNRCHRAVQELIKSKRELDFLFSREYGLQYPDRTREEK
jgi:hypothetical protein